MNRSRPRTYQFSQPFYRVYQVEEFAKLDNISISDVSNSSVNFNQTGNNDNNSQGVPVNLSESGANGRNSSNNNQNNLASSQQNPYNNGSSIFTTFSGPGQSQQYQKVAFGSSNSSNNVQADKGTNAENPEKKRKLQGYSYVRLRHEQNLPRPEAYELLDRDIQFLNQFNQSYSQNLRKENPNKYEELLALQKERQEENADSNKNSALNEINGKQNMNTEGVISILNEDLLEKLFIHFEKKSTKDTTATLQEVKIELPKEYEENLNPRELEELYQYWKTEREREYERQGEKISEKQKELYPFMRKYWRASNEDISAHAAFRPREINRMKTRKSAKPENKETYEKMLSLEGDFKKYRLLALQLKKRELLKREIAYIAITEFNQSIPGLTSEYQIVNKFTSRAQEIKNISNLINPKSSKPQKVHKPKAPKPEQNKETIVQPKDNLEEENINTDENNIVQQQPEFPKKIKINVPKGVELEKKSTFNDEASKVSINGELAEGDETAEKQQESNLIQVEVKKKKKQQKKKVEQAIQSQDTEAQENPLAISGEVPTEPQKKPKKKKPKSDKQNNSSNIISLQLSLPIDSSVSQIYQPPSTNANQDNLTKDQDEEDQEQEQEKPEGIEQEEVSEKKKKSKKKEKSEKSEKPVKKKDPKDPKQRKKKNQTDDSKINEDESAKPDENTQGPSQIEKFDSQSIYHAEAEQSRVERQEESQFPQPVAPKKTVKRQKKIKKQDSMVHEPDSAMGEMSQLDIEKDLKEKPLSKQASIAQILQSEVQIKQMPLIKLDKDLEIEQFLSSFYIYFHQLKLPITVDNVDSSEKIDNKNKEIQEEKKQKLKNPNTLAYLIRKRVGRSNREYLDRTFDSLMDVIGIQSGKIQYLLTPNNDIIYNTYNYVNFDAVKTLSSQSQYNSNNPYSSSHPSSSSAPFSLYQTSSTSATGAAYEDDSFSNPYSTNKRDSKNASDKKFKNLPGNEKLVHEVREKQRQIYESQFFKEKQEKLKQVIQQPYLTQLQRQKRRLPSYFHNNHRQQLWIEDDDTQIEQDDIFMKNLSSLKQTMEDKQKEKEKKLKLQQKQLQEQLKKQKEIEQKEEAARQQLKQKEEQNKIQEQQQFQQNSQFNQQQMQNNQQHQMNQQQSNFNRQQNSSQSFNNNIGENSNYNNPNYFPQEPYLTEQNSYQPFNQPPLHNMQSNYYGFERNGSFDNGMYGQNNMNNGNMENQQNMNMNDELYSPMNMPQRNHQGSFQGGDLNFGAPPQMQGAQSQQSNLQMNQQQSFQDNTYQSYYDNDQYMNGFENNFGNQSNFDNNYYQQYQNNDYIQNDNELENNNYLDENNNNNNYMDDDI